MSTRESSPQHTATAEGPGPLCCKAADREQGSTEAETECARRLVVAVRGVAAAESVGAESGACVSDAEQEQCSDGERHCGRDHASLPRTSFCYLGEQLFVRRVGRRGGPTRQAPPATTSQPWFVSSRQTRSPRSRHALLPRRGGYSELWAAPAFSLRRGASLREHHQWQWPERVAVASASSLPTMPHALLRRRDPRYNLQLFRR